MAARIRLQIRLLGELEVRRDGAPLALPRSKKTRALLAYLAATGRAHRRERLCGIFRDVPDDPRGALRWSLSKLRALVDEPDCPRIVADGDSVRFEPAGASVDVLELRESAAEPPDRLPTPALEDLARSFRGAFLEGLDLPNCPDYQAWRVAERDEAATRHAGILAALVARHAATPETALPHARRWLEIEPYDEAARIELVRLLVGVGRRGEAEQHYAAGLKALGEIGPESVGRLQRAWQALGAAPSAAPDATSDSGAERDPDAWAPWVLPDQPSLALIPLGDPDGGSSPAYLAAGLARELGTALAMAEGIFVIDPSSAAAISAPNLDARQAASRLGVRHVGTLTVDMDAARLRVTVRLGDAVEGTDVLSRAWACRMPDVFALRDDVVAALLGAIVPAAPPGPRAMTPRRPASIEAWDTCQRGIWHLHRRGEEDLSEALRLFQAALELDPALVAARAGMIHAYYYQVALDLLEPDAAWRERIGQDAAEAVALDPADPAAHCALGQARIIMRAPEAAVPAFDRAVELNPCFAWAHYGAGAASVFAGRAAEAVPRLERAIRLSPYDPHMSSYLLRMADAHLFLRRYDAAVEWAQKAIRQPLFQWSRYAVLLSALGHLGRLDEAKEVLAGVLRRRPDFSLELVRRTHLYTDQVELDYVGEPQLFKDQDEFAHYLDGLRKAGVAPDRAR